MFKIVLIVCMSGFCSISDSGSAFNRLEECLTGVAASNLAAKETDHPGVDLHAFCVQASDIDGGLRIMGEDYRAWQNPDSR